MYSDLPGLKRLGIFEGPPKSLFKSLSIVKTINHPLSFQQQIFTDLDLRDPTLNKSLFISSKINAHDIVKYWHRDSYGSSCAILTWSNVYPTQIKECDNDDLLEPGPESYQQVSPNKVVAEHLVSGREIPVRENEVVVFDNRRFVHRMNIYTDTHEPRWFIRAYSTWNKIEENEHVIKETIKQKQKFSHIYEEVKRNIKESQLFKDIWW